MKLQEQIKELEDNKWEVFIDHERKFDPTKRKGYAPKGGRTVATLYKGGIVLVGVAKCSKQDNYNKKLGALIAVGRAKKIADNIDIVEKSFCNK